MAGSGGDYIYMDWIILGLLAWIAFVQIVFVGQAHSLLNSVLRSLASLEMQGNSLEGKIDSR